MPPLTSKEKLDLLSLTKIGMEEFVHAQGWKPYRAEQILRWIYQRGVTEIEQMTDLSIHDRTHLGLIATINRPTITNVVQSRDGTAKFLIRLHDGASIETVLIPERDRRTVCISTQVGCSLDCKFCLTAELGLKRNLNAGEIIGQFLCVQDYLENTYETPPRLTNVVMMGMGEPLANIGPVRDAIQNMIHGRCGLGVSPRRITVSTAGIHQRFNDIVELGVNLAVSLNASTNEQRNTIMPAANRLCSLSELLAACRSLSLPHRRRLTFEYVLLRGVNDSPQDAVRLAGSIRGIPCMVNVIPFNEIPGSPYARPDEATILAFQDILIRHNIDTYLRKSKGPDVLGACGQLGASARETL
jgi:23S rRNA (adenine2503-C2)-methyltransferase